jgi:hypothetical protein
MSHIELIQAYPLWDRLELIQYADPLRGSGMPDLRSGIRGDLVEISPVTIKHSFIVTMVSPSEIPSDRSRRDLSVFETLEQDLDISV